MCYNCGCGNPNDDMGSPDNITNQTFINAAKASEQPEAEAKLNTLALLKQMLEAKKPD